MSVIHFAQARLPVWRAMVQCLRLRAGLRRRLPPNPRGPLRHGILRPAMMRPGGVRLMGAPLAAADRAHAH
jgi:hypothetical protein